MHCEGCRQPGVRITLTHLAQFGIFNLLLCVYNASLKAYDSTRYTNLEGNWTLTAGRIHFSNNTLHNWVCLIIQIQGAGYIIGFVKTQRWETPMSAWYLAHFETNMCTFVKLCHGHFGHHLGCVYGVSGATAVRDIFLILLMRVRSLRPWSSQAAAAIKNP